MIATKSEQQREVKGWALALGFLVVMALMAACLLLTATPAHAKTFTVNTKADSADQKPADGKCFTGQTPGLVGPECTLRAAIQEANKLPGADTIAFNVFGIPGAGLQTIEVGKSGNGALPTITRPLSIDGYTQGGATENTLTEAGQTDAVLKIELDGASAGNTASGLEIDASNVVVRGLVINRFSLAGINLSGGTGHRVEGNFLGTDLNGAQDLGNGYGMIVRSTGSSTIGGAALEACNIISGSDFYGVWLQTGSSGNKIQGNLIGTDKSGTVPLGNSGYGVLDTASSNNNTIGDSDPSDGLTNAANIIAFNGGAGVTVIDLFGDASTGDRILGNSIFSNGSLGIDLNGDGVTANDDRDPDTGANQLQNYPLISSAQMFDDPFLGDTADIRGNLNTTPSARRKKRTFIIQFFSSPAADPSGFGEGKTFLAQIEVNTDRQGNASFGFSSEAVSEGEFVTATATNKATGDTSEFSEARVVEPAEPPVIGGG